MNATNVSNAFPVYTMPLHLLAIAMSVVGLCGNATILVIKLFYYFIFEFDKCKVASYSFATASLELQ